MGSESAKNRLLALSTTMRCVARPHSSVTITKPSMTQRRRAAGTTWSPIQRGTRSQMRRVRSRLRSWSEGGRKSERTAGMKLISSTTALRMPMPVKNPKLRMVAMSNTISEKKPNAATAPATTITGPTATSDANTAWWLAATASICPWARRASYSS